VLLDGKMRGLLESHARAVLKGRRAVLLGVHDYRKHDRLGYHAPMSANARTHWTETLPEALPENPLIVAARWLSQAREDALQPNPNSMVVATVDARGSPSARVADAAVRFGIPYGGPGTPEPASVATPPPRPPHWGGYRLYADAVELWVEGEFRIHDRARWTRTLSERPGVEPCSPWQATRLQP
jgi:hypothetical protein